MPIAFHPEPDSDLDVDGTSTGRTGAVEHSPTAEDPAPVGPRRDPLTERILSRGDASAQATTFSSEADGVQYVLAVFI